MLSTKHCCATVVETHLPRPVLVDAVERVEEPFRFRVRQAQRLKGWGHVLRVEAMQQGVGEVAWTTRRHVSNQSYSGASHSHPTLWHGLLTFNMAASLSLTSELCRTPIGAACLHAKGGRQRSDDVEPSYKLPHAKHGAGGSQ